MNKFTIQDVAERAGVSKATISRFLNNHFEKMSKETKLRIEKTIKELNYTPNPQASSLKTKRSNHFGIVVADIGNTYSAKLLKGITRYTTKHTKLQALIGDTAENPDREHEVIQQLLQQNIDGLILQPYSQDKKDYDYLLEHNIPVVVVDRTVRENPWPAVTSNNLEATTEMALDVLNRGYRDIIVFSKPLQNVTTRNQRFQAFKDVIERYDNAHLTLIESKIGDAQLIIDWMLDHPGVVPLVFASNGELLLNLLKKIQFNHLQIPDQIAICGYDDWDWGDLITPGISTIGQHAELIGQKAAELLLSNLINKDKLKPEEIKIPAKITIRDSF